jgi:hypothetical protein
MKANKAVGALRDSFESVTETFKEQLLDPMVREAGDELLGFLGEDAPFRRKGTLAQEDLKRAREQKRLEELSAQDRQNTQKIIESLKLEYRNSETQRKQEEGPIRQDIEELTVQVVELAKTTGVESKIHLSGSRKEKVSILTIKLLRTIIKTLTLKAKEAKSASELVVHRSNAKTTGMLAWVSGKQMKIHEQGTMQLQG